MTIEKKSIIGATIILGGAIAFGLTSQSVPIELQLKTDVSNILDSREYVEENGVLSVQYAYKTNPITQTQNETSRTPTGYTQSLGNNQYKLTSYSGVNFTNDGGVWKQVEYATTTKTAYDQQVISSPIGRILNKVYADTFFSGAGDGRVFNATAGSTWALTHDAVTGSSSVDNGASGLSARSLDSSSTSFTIARGFFPFDTSTIPSSAVISSATINISVNTKVNTDNDGDDWVNIVQTSQASATTLSTADYDQAGSISNPTEGATRIDIGSISTSGYTTWTLNATGLSWIKKSGEAQNCGVSVGWTCLGIREGHDAINSPLTINTEDSITTFFSEQAGTGSDPYLDVTYTIANSLFIGDF